jgi:mono/diheme cytochrome c family protein
MVRSCSPAHARASTSFSRLLLIGYAASAVLSCAARAPKTAADSQRGPPAALSAAEVHALAERHCASCHQSSVSRAKPNALAVFDLDQANWSAGLAVGQFSVFYQRMQGELDPPTRARLFAYTERERAARAGVVSAARPPESSVATPAP